MGQIRSRRLRTRYEAKISDMRRDLAVVLATTLTFFLLLEIVIHGARAALGH